MIAGLQQNRCELARNRLRLIRLFSVLLLIAAPQSEAARAQDPPGNHDKPQSESPEGSWAFTPPRDEFRSDALLDLRGLNEKLAGEHGFVTRSKDGNDFAFSDGTPARFWAVNDGAFDKNLARH